MFYGSEVHLADRIHKACFMGTLTTTKVFIKSVL